MNFSLNFTGFFEITSLHSFLLFTYLLRTVITFLISINAINKLVNEDVQETIVQFAVATTKHIQMNVNLKMPNVRKPL